MPWFARTILSTDLETIHWILSKTLLYLISKICLILIVKLTSTSHSMGWHTNETADQPTNQPICCVFLKVKVSDNVDN